MREIKFRCWFANKMWHSIPAIRFQELGILQVDLNHDVGDFSGTPDTWTREDDYELMQFTGLLDKNGKEIYESDIVQRLPKSSYPYAWVIKFSPDQGWDLEKYGEYEVIGNVFENKELIGGVS